LNEPKAEKPTTGLCGKLLTTFVGKVFPLSGRRIHTPRAGIMEYWNAGRMKKPEDRRQQTVDRRGNEEPEYPPSPRLRRTGWNDGKYEDKTNCLSPAPLRVPQGR
jgi:hypothetical protein